MRHGHYELMENGRFFGSIPECRGAWGEGGSLEECREELAGAFEAWIIAALRHGDPLPVLDGIDLNVKHWLQEPFDGSRLGLSCNASALVGRALTPHAPRRA